MGGEGLTRATSTAVLSANYVAARLREHYPVLFSGHGGLVAHECILDVRGITRETGVSVDDVAKRLIDYGFHAPTMSFPVPGTLMVEPTESEDLAELDRFCAAMIAIRQEINQVAAGQWPADDNPLRGAPHTAVAIAGKWDHPYTREEAAYPPGVNPRAKYWPPVPPDRRCLRRPQPGLLVPATGGLRRRVTGRPAGSAALTHPASAAPAVCCSPIPIAVAHRCYPPAVAARAAAPSSARPVVAVPMAPLMDTAVVTSKWSSGQPL
jgi:glycine dehydrogenase